MGKVTKPKEEGGRGGGKGKRGARGEQMRRAKYGQKRDRRGRKGPVRSFLHSFVPGIQVEGSGSHDPA